MIVSASHPQTPLFRFAANSTFSSVWFARSNHSKIAMKYRAVFSSRRECQISIEKVHGNDWG
jgi:hypothetical protein